ncbi:MAG: 8-amino-7-oxononanoate synthase [Thermoanaerobaculia bacterium]|nr:8-amino-7-oxononanoate synthase [Thermoanaerobaculia bacterium]
MRSLRADLAERLADLRRADLERSLQVGQGVDLSSNDYLGLSRHPGLREGVRRRLEDENATVGAPASRLLRGHTELHARLESRLAAWKGTETALLLPSGWQANAAVLTALVQPGDRILSDELNHASLIDGIRSTRCSKVILPHRDVDSVARHLNESWPGRTFLVTESLFSMDGDVAPLDAYADLCRRFRAEMIVDDAHAVGLFGNRGSGLVEHFGITDSCAAVTSTCGKALGVGGAFVGLPTTVRDWMVNTARPFLFSTAVPPLLLHALDTVLDLLERESWRRERVLQLADGLRTRLRSAGLGLLSTQGPIVPVVVGENADALRCAAELRRLGFDVRAIRPPTVPAGTARLRLSIHADHDSSMLERLADALVELLAPVATS